METDFPEDQIEAHETSVDMARQLAGNLSELKAQIAERDFMNSNSGETAECPEEPRFNWDKRVSVWFKGFWSNVPQMKANFPRSGNNIYQTALNQIKEYYAAASPQTRSDIDRILKENGFPPIN
jgi:hypothetical protein